MAKEQERVYVDSVVWIGAFDSKDKRHVQSKNILNRLLNIGRKNSLFLSDYVFSEVLSHITSRQKYQGYTEESRKRYVNDVYESIYNSRYVKILKVSELNLGTALIYMINRTHLIASLTDWSSLILMIENNISKIATLDPDFMKIINEISEFKHIEVLEK